MGGPTHLKYQNLWRKRELVLLYVMEKFSRHSEAALEKWDRTPF
jgi:hypothetical protein